ncbi:MAG TPA: MASE1 domain-containing protein [Gammaproteobacteria bacterium]|nr:MASE1 domain-containing protein [Gammaproteobacteria bacterium]
MKKAFATVLSDAALLIVYFATAKFGLSFFALIHPSASAVWLPTGIAMAAVLLGGVRFLPAVFVGAFLANVTTAGSVSSSLGVALGNTLEAVLAVTLVERFAGGRHAFDSPAGILKFIVLAAFLSTTVSATLGVLSLTLGGVPTDAAAGEVWLTWWLGDAAGAVVVTPLVVLWWTNRSWDLAARKLVEAALHIAAIGAVGAATFFHPRLSQYPIAFLCLAPLVWGALRFGPREIATAIAVLGVVATTATATDRGPFAMLTTNESLLVLQAFLVLISMTALPMAALTVERRAALKRERAARAEADAASRSKDEFLAILSHELRNPLAAISMAAAVLDSGAQTGEGSVRLVESIRRQAQHLARLIDDLLDIGRMTANKLILRKEPLELAEAARRCVEMLAQTRGLAAGRIELALEAVWIDADPVRIAQVMENLLGNALKHTPLGKRIRVTVRDLGAVAELSVEDEGFGIPPELLPNVFDPFTQGRQGLDRSAGGLGLGLTLVRRLTELHNGTIVARSGGVDRGSAFTLRFPSYTAPPAAVAAASERARADRPRRLLVVEDNVDARQTLRTLLETLGHEVHEAADGEAGVAAALERRPDLVFVDIGLPLLDGYEVARRLREAKFGARLVALTGYGRDDDVKRAREAGFDEHLLKPATLEQLRAAIDAVAAA